MNRRLAGLLAVSSLALACGGDRALEPSSPLGRPSSQVAFRVADAGPVLSDAYGGRYPPAVHLAADPTGALLALWVEASPAEVRVARFDPVRGWLSPQTLATATNVGPGGVTLDAAGRGLALWTQCCPWVTWAARYDRAQGWAAPERVQPDPSAVAGNRGRGISRLSATLVGHKTGEAFALWNQRDNAYAGCYPGCPPAALAAARFTPDDGWEPAEIVLSDRVFDRLRDAVFDDTGQIVVAASGTGSSGIVIIRRDGTRGWGRGESLATYPANDARIAAGPAGALAVLWRNRYPGYDGGLTLVYPTIVGSLFDEATGWSPPAPVVDADVATHFAFDAAGTGTLVWIQDGAVRSRSVTLGTGWGPVEAVTDGPAESASLLVEPSGDASVVLWSGPELVLVRRAGNGGWSTRRTLAVSSAGNHTTPSLIADSQGNGFALWADTDQDKNVSIWAVRFRTVGP